MFVDLKNRWTFVVPRIDLRTDYYIDSKMLSVFEHLKK